MDKRLVRTVLSGIVALLAWRKRAHGLLLSEVGAYVLDPAHAPAGAKRLSTLLRSPHWSAEDLTAYVWRQADVRLQALATVGEEAQVIWDQRVVEKPESLAAPDLGGSAREQSPASHSYQAGLLPSPQPSDFCAGLAVVGAAPARAERREWTANGGSYALVEWWSTRGPHASDRRTEEYALLRHGARRWGRWGQRVCPVWDPRILGSRLRRPALAARRPGAPTALCAALARALQTLGAAHRLATRQSLGTGPWSAQLGAPQLGARSWEHRLLWDARHHCPRHHCPRHHCPRHHCPRRTGVLALPVWLPDDRTHLRPSGWSSLAGEVARNRGIS